MRDVQRDECGCMQLSKRVVTRETNEMGIENTSSVSID